MYEGIKAGSKIDVDFEYGWFMESIELHCDGLDYKAREVLRGMFCGILRIVTGYKWLEEAPTAVDLAGVRLAMEIVPNENGKNRNEVLGNWDVIFRFEQCPDRAEKATTRATLYSIEKTMERFIRSRFKIEEPKDLAVFLLEQQRKELVEKHFVGVSEA